jgi:hypothetical protein
MQLEFTRFGAVCKLVLLPDGASYSRYTLMDADRGRLTKVIEAPKPEAECPHRSAGGSDC